MSDEGGKKQLDLGLSELIKSASEIEESLEGEQGLNSAKENLSSSDLALTTKDRLMRDEHQQARLDPVHREFLNLAAQSEWKKIEELIENGFVDQGGDRLLEKIFWIRAKIHLAKMPPQLLLGPFEEILNAFLKLPNGDQKELLRLELATVIQELIASLKSVSDDAGIVNIARLSFGQFNIDSNLDLIVNSLATEIKKNKNWLADSSNISRRDLGERQIREMERFQEEIVREQNAKLLRNEFSKNGVSGSILPYDRDSEIKVSQVDNFAAAISNRTRVNKLWWLASATLVVVVTTWLIVLVDWSGSWRSDLVARLKVILPEVNVSFGEPQYLAAQLSPKVGLGNLDALLYSIDNINLNKPKVEKTQTSHSKDSQSLQKDQALHGEQQRAEPSKPISRKEESGQSDDRTVNTSGPKEPADFNFGDRLPESRDLGAPPSINFPPFISGGSIGPRSDLLPPIDPPNRQTRGGKTRRFLITAPTKVMSEPSYWSDTLEKLDVGDEISVDQVVGKWLKILSRRGRSGYVLSLDAEEIPR
ncbi:MAG TPA: hypothetical protein PKD37_06270 [Oligoflexia bacterium]|nr:hypothetical protein [Oligoflexia bacterium]HMP27567.1 hypothetical protein [Oligoflexia bacterium]